jgi:hypothetical protein
VERERDEGVKGKGLSGVEQIGNVVVVVMVVVVAVIVVVAEIGRKGG